MLRVITDDSSQWPTEYIPTQPSVVKHLAGDNLDTQFNCYPYNDYAPPHLANAAGPQRPTRLSVQTRLSLQYDIDEAEVDNFQYDIENHKDTEFKIIGSNIILTRRKWGWSLKSEDETKLLMANTLHEPDWAEQWDEHFKARGEINLRTWEWYGMVAKHRREKAAEQGLGPEMMPKCVKGCEMGCHDIKTAPMAAVVKKYLSPPKRRIRCRGYRCPESVTDSEAE